MRTENVFFTVGFLLAVSVCKVAVSRLPNYDSELLRSGPGWFFLCGTAGALTGGLFYIAYRAVHHCVLAIKSRVKPTKSHNSLY